MARTINQRTTVEDMRGKPATARSVFRKGVKSLIPDVISAIRTSRANNFDDVVARFRQQVQTELASKDAPNAAAMNASRTFTRQQTAKREQARADDVTRRVAAAHKNDPEWQATLKKISDAFRKAITGKSLIGRKP